MPQLKNQNPYSFMTPSRAWQRVGIDFLQIGNKKFLIMTDYFSLFFKIKNELLKNQRVDTIFVRISFLAMGYQTFSSQTVEPNFLVKNSPRLG